MTTTTSLRCCSASCFRAGSPHLFQNQNRIDHREGQSAVTQRLPKMPTTIPGYDTVYEVLRSGDGAAVAKGAEVTVHATGVVKETGKKFWSTKDPGQQPFTYKAGVGQVITGWDQGLLGMKTAEERKLTIPAHEGYGAEGFPAWGIPPNGTLEFTLEVLTIK